MFLVASIRYSSSCELVLAVKGQGVHGFTLDSHVGEFILTKPYMRIPEVGSSHRPSYIWFWWLVASCRVLCGDTYVP